MINNYLTGESEQEDHVIHLLFSANRWEAAASIRADIEAGTTVVIDRYYYSGCVYSAAKDNSSLSLEWSRHAEVGLPRPDICLFLDISAEEAAKRGGFGGERYENQRHQDRVRALFGQLRIHDDESADIVPIDAGKSKDEVAEELWAVVGKKFAEGGASDSPLRAVVSW